MSQVTGNLTINDGSATPVAKTFSPLEVSPALTIFAEKSSGASSGYITLSVGFDRAKSNRPTNKVSVELALPVTSVVNGITTVVDIGRFKGQFILPESFTAQQRADMHAFVANALNNALVKAVIKDLDPMY